MFEGRISHDFRHACEDLHLQSVFVKNKKAVTFFVVFQ